MRILYHLWLSPFCRKVRIVLMEKQLDFELKTENIWERRQEFLALNPAGEVPVLVESDGTALSGSDAICEFLDEVHPEPPLLGRQALGRAEVRRLVHWFDGKFNAEVTEANVGEKIRLRRRRQVRELLGKAIVLLALSACVVNWEPPKGTGSHDRWADRADRWGGPSHAFFLLLLLFLTIRRSSPPEAYRTLPQLRGAMRGTRVGGGSGERGGGREIAASELEGVTEARNLESCDTSSPLTKKRARLPPSLPKTSRAGQKTAVSRASQAIGPAPA